MDKLQRQREKLEKKKSEVADSDLETQPKVLKPLVIEKFVAKRKKTTR